MYELADMLANAFGVEEMINYICSLSNEQILQAIEKA